MEAIHPLKKFRTDQDPPLSRKALADLLGVDRQTIYRWETAKRKPEGDDLKKVIEKTGIPARELRPDLVELLGSAA